MSRTKSKDTKTGRKQMSSMRKANEPEVIGIFCSDIHLSLRAPIWRSAEPDWFAAMKRPLDELKGLQAKYGCPIFCCGDLFDKWNSPPELINFAIDNLPFMHCIPGQHDLPHHSLEDINKSAYYTLCKAKTIRDITHRPVEHGKLMIHGFPFGERPPDNWPTGPDSKPRIALIHEYTWIKGKGYPGATADSHLKPLQHSGWDLVFCGDNHQAFIHQSFINCGGFMRRHANERLYDPSIWLMEKSKDGIVEPYVVRHELDTSKDVYLEIDTNDFDLDDPSLRQLSKALQKLESEDLDFAQYLEQYCKRQKVRRVVADILKSAVEKESK